MWKGKRIEEVSEFKYLGYVLKKNGGNDGQIRELKKKGNIAVQTLWLFRHRDQSFEVFRKSRYKPYVADLGRTSSALLSIVILYLLLDKEHLKPS